MQIDAGQDKVRFVIDNIEPRFWHFERYLTLVTGQFLRLDACILQTDAATSEAAAKGMWELLYAARREAGAMDVFRERGGPAAPDVCHFDEVIRPRRFDPMDPIFERVVHAAMLERIDAQLVLAAAWEPESYVARMRNLRQGLAGALRLDYAAWAREVTHIPLGEHSLFAHVVRTRRHLDGAGRWCRTSATVHHVGARSATAWERYRELNVFSPRLAPLPEIGPHDGSYQ